MAEQTQLTGSSPEVAACSAMIQLANILHRAINEGKKITVTYDSPIVQVDKPDSATFHVKHEGGKVVHWKSTGKVIFKVVVEPAEPGTMTSEKSA